jgi:hypothetical protein
MSGLAAILSSSTFHRPGQTQQPAIGCNPQEQNPTLESTYLREAHFKEALAHGLLQVFAAAEIGASIYYSHTH